jgi:hypothetical protein
MRDVRVVKRVYEKGLEAPREQSLEALEAPSADIVREGGGRLLDKTETVTASPDAT